MSEALKAALGTGAIFAFVQFLITRYDEKHDAIKDLKSYIKSKFEEIDSKFKEIEKRQVVAEKDALRTQLLTLITSMPDEQQEILTLAKHYFVDLQGDWYMTSIFKKWCDGHDLEPEWFDSKE